MNLAALVVAVLALAFTLASFWWLHARTGSLTAARPRTYAFANTVRVRLPVTFFNTGAKALIVGDLRIVLDDGPTRPPFEWITTRTRLRPGSEDGFAFATPFAIEGRSTREVIAEFGDDLGWSPVPGTVYRMRLQAEIHPAEEWVDVVSFDWCSPPSEDVMATYIAHRNAPT